MAISLTRMVGFHARHRYYRPEWSESRNREVFGSLGGSLDETGMVIDLGLLDRILHDEVLIPFAGKHLNLDLPAFAFPRIAARLPGGLVLERMRIMEDPTLYADCTGDA